MITEDYVSYEVAKLLKENGFDSEEVGCLGGFYSDSCYESGHGIKTQSGQEVGIVYDGLTNSELEHDEYLRPTLQMACKWLRVTHNIYIEVEPHTFDGDCASSYECNYWFNGNFYIPYTTRGHPLENKKYRTYEEALNSVIEYCLTNLI